MPTRQSVHAKIPFGFEETEKEKQDFILRPQPYPGIGSYKSDFQSRQRKNLTYDDPYATLQHYWKSFRAGSAN